MSKALVVLAFIGLSLGGCTAGNNKPVKQKQYKYYCTMHPQIGADKPGICSKCGMQLVERDTTR
ncbi:MAG: hypothetical protein JWR50_603 [Mucilaginibacter sp.]|nr:hypothetical protein [Mucilaginibacter sp.]